MAWSSYKHRMPVPALNYEQPDRVLGLNFRLSNDRMARSFRTYPYKLDHKYCFKCFLCHLLLWDLEIERLTPTNRKITKSKEANLMPNRRIFGVARPTHWTRFTDAIYLCFIKFIINLVSNPTCSRADKSLCHGSPNSRYLQAASHSHADLWFHSDAEIAKRLVTSPLLKAVLRPCLRDLQPSSHSHWDSAFLMSSIRCEDQKHPQGNVPMAAIPDWNSSRFGLSASPTVQWS